MTTRIPVGVRLSKSRIDSLEASSKFMGRFATDQHLEAAEPRQVRACETSGQLPRGRRLLTSAPTAQSTRLRVTSNPLDKATPPIAAESTTAL